jgi:hypothetical protein
VANREQTQDYINTKGIQRHNHTFHFINILHK